MSLADAISREPVLGAKLRELVKQLRLRAEEFDDRWLLEKRAGVAGMPEELGEIVSHNLITILGHLCALGCLATDEVALINSVEDDCGIVHLCDLRVVSGFASLLIDGHLLVAQDTGWLTVAKHALGDDWSGIIWKI